MRIIRNYILKEVIGTFLLSVIVFTFVLLIGNIVKIADLVINKGVDLISISKMLLCLAPYLLSFTMPMALLTATLLTFGRLSGDSEIIAMRASGISLYQIAFPAVLLGLIFSLLSIPLNDTLLPNAHFLSRRMVKEIGMRRPTAYLEEGTFVRGFGNFVMFIYQINKNRLKNIRIYQPQEGGPTRTVIAESGVITPHPETSTVELNLYNGTSEEPSPVDPSIFYKLNFKNYTMTLDLSKQIQSDRIQKKTKEMTIKELQKEIEKNKRESIDSVPLFTEIHKKISLSFSSLIFVLIGIPLGIVSHRSEKSVGFGISLILFLLYWGLLLGGTALAYQGTVPPWLGVWISNIVFFVLGAFLFFRTAVR
ncbi:MAG: LptF/LptG family permease [Candidatus Omnitrophota bacterium]